MKNQVILGFIRHALTILGGGLVHKGLMDSSELDQGAGALCVLIGLAWSAWQKTRAGQANSGEANGNSGQGPAALAALLLLVPALLLQGACKTPELAPGGVYQGNAALYQADQTILTAYDALHSFVQWEYENRAALAEWPEIARAADHIRLHARAWLGSARALRDAYANSPTPENGASLESALAVLRAAMREATGYIIEQKVMTAPGVP